MKEGVEGVDNVVIPFDMSGHRKQETMALWENIPEKIS